MHTLTGDHCWLLLQQVKHQLDQNSSASSKLPRLVPLHGEQTCIRASPFPTGSVYVVLGLAALTDEGTYYFIQHRLY